jgi:drug/metabolite transporter (DMT)-like permease
MHWLILASLLWAFSFGLIKTQLVDYDPLAVAWLRLALSLLIFLPFLPRKRVDTGDRWRLILLGAVQFGLMYMLYISSYRWLPAYAVALLTVLTPLYVVLLNDLLSRRISLPHLGGALLAIVGAGWIAFVALPVRDAWPGIVILQAANLCFAVGQVLYRRLRRRRSMALHGDATLMAWMYLGAVMVSGLGVWRAGGIDPGLLSGDPLLAWIYLGLVPSGVAFWLWNKGAALTDGGKLAVANNLKIPMGIAVAALVFGESVSWAKLLVGSVIIMLGFLCVGKRRIIR